MNAKKCDRCGEYYEHYVLEYGCNALIPVTMGEDGFPLEHYKRLDLCTKCMGEFADWMISGKEK